ncbi:MAG: DUF262 domain-containing protein [Syntrophales bacterium]|nr:DUF262 domain-containing protein [Syntrophales bacterium]
MFQPRTQYDVVFDKNDIHDFYEFTDDFVTRPPYQRKDVWSTKKQQALLDSLFRGFYIPRLVLREVRLSDDRVVREVVDGQQRITTVQLFFADKLKLPASLATLDPRLGGMRYSELPDEIRKYAFKNLKFETDIIKGIDNPKSSEHLKIATEIFWRLQLGESLNFMEVAHARLSSPIRNFIVKYADDISFDYSAYKPIDNNPGKHRFFRVIDRGNDRMQHLSLLGRLLLIERAGGPTEVRDKVLAEWIDETQTQEGIGNLEFEKDPIAVALLKTLKLFYDVFRTDPAVDEDNGVKELNIEYFIISMVMLVRYLQRHYAFLPDHHKHFREFTYEFHRRWKLHSDDDRDILIFSDNRQQSKADLENRDKILCQAFFEHLEEHGIEIKVLDAKRAFNEAERIRVYRKQEGLCQMCLGVGKSKDKAAVSWSEYQTHHILPWIKGGPTTEDNAQVLCKDHHTAIGWR